MAIVIQRVSRLKHIPSSLDIKSWAASAIGQKLPKAEVTLRIVNKKESAALNQTFRHKSGPTNVLSFEYSLSPLQGDIVLCAPMIKTRAQWAHLVIHGTLHLRGYNHIDPEDAVKMEKLEIKLLKKWGFDDPYTESNINPY